jgi:hypothetical protein
LPESGTRSSRIFEPIQPARRAVAASGFRLDDLADEEMLWHDEQVYDGEGFQIVIHQQKIGIVAGGQTLAFGMKLAVQNFRAESTLLAL